MPGVERVVLEQAAINQVSLYALMMSGEYVGSFEAVKYDLVKGDQAENVCGRPQVLRLGSRLPHERQETESSG